MSFLGPDVKLKPWRQRWWWREHLPGVVGLLVVVVAAVATAVVVFALDDDEAGGPPRDTASRPVGTNPSSHRPTEKTPKLPDKAREPSREGIEATVRFEVSAINYAQRTGDFEPLKSVYNMDKCKFCKLMVETISTTVKDGATYIDAEYSILAIEPTVNVGRGNEVIGYANVSQQQPKEAILLGSDGKEIEKRPADLDIESFYSLSFTSGNWIIQEVS